jgi:hypothetical protein
MVSGRVLPALIKFGYCDVILGEKRNYQNYKVGTFDLPYQDMIPII